MARLPIRWFFSHITRSFPFFLLLSLMIFDGVSSIFMTSSDLSASRYEWKIMKSASSVASVDRKEIKCSRLINHFVSFYFPIFTIIFVQQNMFFIFLKSCYFHSSLTQIFVLEFLVSTEKFLHFTSFIVTLMRMRQFWVKQMKEMSFSLLPCQH